MNNNSTDTLSSMTGGTLGAILTFIIGHDLMQLIIFSLIGGFLGTFGKNAGAYSWNWVKDKWIKNKFKRKEKDNTED